jgi:hypothetical protein
MKILITAVAITAMLATSAVAQTPRTKEVRVQPNNSVNRNAVSPSPPNNSVNHNAVSHNPVTYPNSNCRFEHRETDPDPRIRLQLYRDCREHELTEVE